MLIRLKDQVIELCFCILLIIISVFLFFSLTCFAKESFFMQLNPKDATTMLHNSFFRDRVDAGIKLATRLQHYKNSSDTIVLGLPRGGVVVAAEVARELNLPLDLVVPRKIGMPHHPEYAVGALTEDGEIFLNTEQLKYSHISENDLKPTIQEEMEEAQRRLKVYRAGREPRQFAGKKLIIVDDGLATGFTMMASISACRSRGASSIIVAVPVMPSDRVIEFSKLCDELVFVLAAKDFSAVGQFYVAFGQTDDYEVVSCMQAAAARMEQQRQQQQAQTQKQQTTEAGGESIDITEAIL